MFANHNMDTLGLGSTRDTVKLPEGEDLNEWLAVHVVHFQDQLLMLHSSICDLCTNETCPVMCAGTFRYLWSDGTKYPRPIEVSAPTYIGLLFAWVDEQLSDETIFPVAVGVPFPSNFEKVIQDIMRRLFRIYAHCFHHHLENFNTLGSTKHLNTSFKQFVFFAKEFKLIGSEQLKPLDTIIAEIMK